MARRATREKILDVAGDLLREGGTAAVSFDTIARRLAMSKQAVLYWFPSRMALLKALFVPFLEAEADAAEAALTRAGTAAEAIERFVRAIVAFHLSDLDRFRMMYLAPQLARARQDGRGESEPLDEIHRATDRLYSLLANGLDGGRRDAASLRAVSVHTAVLGHVMMVALAEAIDDPLKHPETTLVDALVELLT